MRIPGVTPGGAGRAAGSGKEARRADRQRGGPRRFRICVLALLATVGVGASSAAVAQSEYAGQEPDGVAPDELQCLALSLYFEARSEGEEGMIAVGSVVLNRVANEEFPNNVCSVVYQGGETPPCQFSWWCDGRSDLPRDADMWQLAREVARRLLTDAPEDPTDGALFFHSAGIDVPWRMPRTRTVQILQHVYYR
jgi:N-acetylmuramoyl-L-alanine amidase